MGGELILYDRVIANPPFSLDEWGAEVAEGDKYGRFRFGVPPKTKGDLAFVQHMVATLNVKGKLGVVMPHGVLFRGASEGAIREGLLKEDLFEAIIGLPQNLFYGTGIPAEHVPHIFDPFYTTKPVGEGTGLGLAICYRIVSELCGTIICESRPGEGASFTVRLPALQRPDVNPSCSELPGIGGARKRGHPHNQES